MPSKKKVGNNHLQKYWKLQKRYCREKRERMRCNIREMNKKTENRKQKTTEAMERKGPNNYQNHSLTRQAVADITY